MKPDVSGGFTLKRQESGDVGNTSGRRLREGDRGKCGITGDHATAEFKRLQRRGVLLGRILSRRRRRHMVLQRLTHAPSHEILLLSRDGG